MEKITVAWADEKQTIVLCTYLKDGWTQEESYRVLEQQQALIESSPADVVDVIVDARAIRWLPVRASFKKGLDRFVELKHPRQGITVFVGARGILASMMKVMMSLIDRQGREFFFVATMEEALGKVAQVSTSRQGELR